MGFRKQRVGRELASQNTARNNAHRNRVIGGLATARSGGLIPLPEVTERPPLQRREKAPLPERTQEFLREVHARLAASATKGAEVEQPTIQVELVDTIVPTDGTVEV